MSATDDPDLSVEPDGLEAATVLGDTYARTLLSDRRHPAGTVMRIRQRTLTSDVRLDDLGLGLGSGAEVDPMETFVFSELNSDRARFRPCGRTRYQPGESYLVAEPDRAYIGTLEDITMSMVLIRPGLLDKVAATAGPPGSPIRFVAHEPGTTQAAERWRAACTYVRKSVLALPDTVDQRLVRANAASLLAAIALDTFANNASSDPDSRDRRDGHPLTVRRAVRFIEDNAARDIDAADIAMAASVSIRALQLAFRRHLDTTPMAHLRRVRLAHAHDELEAAHGDEVTVMSVASRWGFGNPGRFARLFREEFGRAPSEVLRSA